MKQKTVTSILSFGIFSSFFLPLFEWHSFEMSGINFILSTHIPPYKYFLLLVPFSTIFLFFGALNDENYFFSRKILSWVPLLSLIFVSVMRYSNGNRFSSAGNIFYAVDLGFWLMLCFSLLLAWSNRKNRLIITAKKMGLL